MVTFPARVRTALVFLLAISAVEAGSARALPVEQTPAVRAEFIHRFLAPDDVPLVSYRAFRHLAASTRGGKMRASIDAWTTLDPTGGFTFEVTASEGSGLIQKRVLIAALEAERDAVKATDRGQSALTPANYDFLDITAEDGRLVKMDVKPKRKHVMLIDGALFIEADSADLVRIEGDLSKRPSFWTRRVRVVREYDRVGGVHVPVSMTSTADVLIVGASTFSMTYRYAENQRKADPREVAQAFKRAFAARLKPRTTTHTLRIQPIQHARIGNRLAHVLEPADPRDDALDAHAEAAVRHRAVAAQIEIPLERFLRQVVLLDPLQQQIEIGEALAAADDLAVAFGRQHVDARAPAPARSGSGFM